jgi:hypothetical protein
VPGRPSRLTPARERAILEVIRAGNYFTTACAAAGISPNTGNKWLDRGRLELERIELGITDAQREAQDLPPAAQEARYARFAQQVALMRAEAEVRVVKFIHKDIEGGHVKEKRKDPETNEIVTVYAGPNGRLGLEWLSRVHARRYGRRQTVELTGEGGGPVGIDATAGQRLAEQLKDFYAAIREDPRVIDVQPVRRELVGPADSVDRSVDDAG